MAAGTRGSKRGTSGNKAAKKRTTKKATKKTTRKTGADKASKNRPAKKVTKKVAKKTAKKATKKITKKTAKKAIKKATTSVKSRKTSKRAPTTRSTGRSSSPVLETAAATTAPDHMISMIEYETLAAKLLAFEVKQKILAKKLRASEDELSQMRRTQTKPQPSKAAPPPMEQSFLTALTQGFNDLDEIDELDDKDNGEVDLHSTLLDDESSLGLNDSADSTPDFKEKDGQVDQSYDDYDDDSDYIDSSDDSSERRRELDRERSDRELELEDEIFWLVCPKCGEHLIEHDFDNIKVERCESCGVVCLDKGEIELFLSTDDAQSVAFRAKGLFQ